MCNVRLLVTHFFITVPILRVITGLEPIDYNFLVGNDGRLYEITIYISM